MEFKKTYFYSIAAGIFLAFLNILAFLHSAFFVPGLLIAFLVAIMPILIDFFVKLQRQKEIEARFPDFVRNLVGAVKSGMPAPKAIVYVASIEYGALTPYVKKLANQIEWSIPLHKALLHFATQTNNTVIKRTIASVIEAEVSGGNIEDVLESITASVSNIKKIKEKREASVHGQLVQSYVIFFIFIIVMIVIQNLLIPYMTKLEQTQTGEVGGGIIKTGFSGLTKTVHVDYSSFGNFFKSMGAWFGSLNGVFLMMSMIQAFFAGIVVGKLATGELSAGLKHSVIMMALSFFVMSLAQGLAGG